MRVDGWEHALVAAIELHAAEPFAYGRSDCFQLAADAVRAVTGRNRLWRWRRYSTELGAARVLRRAGVADVGALLATVFAKECPPSLARRGDVGVIRRDGQIAAGVFTSFGFAVKAEHGLLYEPVTAADRAFRVD